MTENTENTQEDGAFATQSAGKDGEPLKPMQVLQPHWKKPPGIMDLKADYEEAKPIHDAQVLRIKRWLDNLNVTGAAKPKPLAGRSSVQPKLIRKQAEWRYAALSEPFLSTDDLFKVKPVSWEDVQAARQNETLLNYQFGCRIDKIKFIDEYVRTAVDEGTVIIKTGWEFEEKEIEVDVPDQVRFVVDPAFAPTLQQVAQLQQTSPSEFDAVPDELKQALQLSIQSQKPIRPEVLSTKRVKQMKTVKNCPTAEICNNANVVIDPTCYGDIDKAGFVIHAFPSSLAELKKDSRYKNLDQILVTSNSILGEPDFAATKEEANFNFRDQPRAKFVVYEYWGYRDVNGDGKLVPIVAAWVGNTLIRLEENPFPDQKPPFILEHYLPVRKGTHGEPDGELLEDNQKVLGAVTRGMIDLMGRSANAQQGIRKDMLDATNRRKFDKGLDYEFNPNVDPRVGVHMHTYPEIPQSAQFMLQLQSQEAESITGVKSWSQGVSGQALGDVAIAVRGALDAASKRELGILRRLSNGIVKLGRKFITMNAAFLSDVEVVRVTNEQFVPVRRDDLPGNFDLKLSISTAEEDNNKAQQLAFMLQTLGPNADPNERKMILAEIARLRKMPDLAKKIETFQPQPDPFTVQQQQLQLKFLQSQIDLNEAQAAHYGSNAQLHGAKIATEAVKQDHIKSDTDLKNLQFVEQESGVHQERELQKIGAQAGAQVVQQQARDNAQQQAQAAQAATNLQSQVVQHHLNAAEAAKDRQHDLIKEFVKGRNQQVKQKAGAAA